MKVEIKTSPKTEVVFKSTTSEQGAEIARKESKKILKKIGIKIEDKNWNVYERLRTNGVVIMQTLYEIRDNPDSRFWKAPGITPSNEQIFETLEELWLDKKLNSNNYEELLDKISKEESLSKEKKQLEEFIFNFKKLEKEINPSASQSNLYKFFATLIGLSESITFNGKQVDKVKTRAVFAKEAYASPNAFTRDILGADLKRMKDDLMNSISNENKQVARWDKNTPVEVLPMGFNSKTYTANKDGILKYKVIDSDGNEEVLKSFYVKKGTPIEFNKNSQKECIDFYKEGIKYAKSKDLQPKSAFKHTVLKFTGNRRVYLFNEELKKEGFKEIKKEQGIIDAVFERLIDSPGRERGVFIICNPDYASEIKETIDIVKQEGINPPVSKVILIRASAAGEQYGGLEAIAGKNDKQFIIELEGDELGKHELEEGDMYREIHYSSERIKKSMETLFSQAKSENISKVFIVLDVEKRDYDKKVWQIAKEKIEILSKDSGIEYELAPRVKAAQIWLTEGTKDNVIVWMPNLWGDVLSDKQWGTMISALLFSDGREGYELGAKGTDPNNEYELKRLGVFKHSILDILNAQALSIASVANLTEEQETKDYYLTRSKALRTALVKTIQNGYLVPYISDSFKLKEGKEKKLVGASTMMKSVELEVLKELTQCNQLKISDEDIKNLEKDLENIAQLENLVLSIDKDQGGFAKQSSNIWRKATFAINESKERIGVNDFYIELPTDTDYSKLNKNNLLEFQVARSEHILSPGVSSTLDKLKKSLLNIGAKDVDSFIREESRFSPL